MDMEDPSEEKMLTNLLRDPEEALRTEPQFPHMLNQQPAAGKNSEQEVQHQTRGPRLHDTLLFLDVPHAVLPPEEATGHSVPQTVNGGSRTPHTGASETSRGQA